MVQGWGHTVTHVWFSLLMWHQGHIFWLESFETYEECHDHQVILEEQMPSDKFACPFIIVEET